MARFLFAGYFGCGNLGDDAILLGLLHGLQSLSLDHEFEVLAGNPDALRREYNLNGIPRRDMNEVTKAIARCDALVFPGGSIFQDVTSVRSVAYYSELVKRAKKAGKKVFLLAQGVGPLNKFFGKKLAADAFKAADLVSVRDPASASALQAIGVNRLVKITADPAFLLPVRRENDGDPGFQVGGMTTVAVAPRSFGKNNEAAKFFSEFCDLLFKNGMAPMLIPMDMEEDVALIDAIEKHHGGRILRLNKVANPVLVQQRMSRMDGVVALRLHASILAANIGIPPFILSYDPKTTALARLLGFEAPPMVAQTTPARAFDLFKEHQKKKERNSQVMAKKLEELRTQALLNASILQEAFGSTATIK